MQAPVQLPFQLQEGQKPTPEQIQAIQQHIAQEAARNGMTIPQYVELMKRQQHQFQQKQQQFQKQQQQHQGRQTQGQSQNQHSHHNHSHEHPQATSHDQKHTINLNSAPPPTPEALAIADFLRSQNLKMRSCLYQEKRRDLFRVKRAIRALLSPEYQKARSKNGLLPEVFDRASAENVFKRLPMSVLALQVEKVEPHQDHGPTRSKRVKGFWTVRVVPQQEAKDDSHYVWLYEGSQWKQKLYAVGALVGVVSIVMFPLWPLVLRQAVWYLSMGFIGLVGLFLALTVFRFILFCLTVFSFPPGLWLYPNLLEDVGFFDSFRPVWAWQETPEERKQKRDEKRQRRLQRKQSKGNGALPTSPSASTAKEGGQPKSKPVNTSKSQPVSHPEATSTAMEPRETNAHSRGSFKAYVEEDDNDS